LLLVLRGSQGQGIVRQKVGTTTTVHIAMLGSLELHSWQGKTISTTDADGAPVLSTQTLPAASHYFAFAPIIVVFPLSYSVCLVIIIVYVLPLVGTC